MGVPQSRLDAVVKERDGRIGALTQRITEKQTIIDQRGTEVTQLTARLDACSKQLLIPQPESVDDGPQDSYHFQVRLPLKDANTVATLLDDTPPPYSSHVKGHDASDMPGSKGLPPPDGTQLEDVAEPEGNAFSPDIREVLETGNWVLSLAGVDQEFLSNAKAILMGVIGEFGKGKTFFLRMLTGENEVLGPEGHDVHTDGLCFKFFPFNRREQLSQCMIVDAAGVNSPIVFGDLGEDETIRDEQHLQDSIFVADLQDKFYQNLVVNLTDIIFVVINQVGRSDVQRVRMACEAARQAQADGKPKTLFIIHNLMHIDTPKRLLKIWMQEIGKVFGAEKEQRVVAESEIDGSDGGIRPLELTHEMAKVPVRHFALVRNTQSWGGDYNKTCIDLIRNTINRLIKHQRTDWSDVHAFGNCVGKVMQNTLKNCKGLHMHKINEKQWLMVPLKTPGSQEIQPLQWTKDINAISGEGTFVLQSKMFVGKATDEVNEQEWPPGKKPIVGKKYLITDLNICGARFEAVNCKLEHDEETGLPSLIVRGEVAHSAAPFAQQQSYSDSLGKGTFCERFDLPSRIKEETIARCVSEQRFIRIYVEVCDPITTEF